MKIGNLTVGVHNTSERSDTKLGKPFSKAIEKGKEESLKQSREYWNLILDDNTGR